MDLCDYSFRNLGRFVQMLSLPHLLCPQFPVESPVCAPREFCSPAFPKQMASSSIPLGIPHVLFSLNIHSSHPHRHSFILQQQEPFAFAHQALLEGLWAQPIAGGTAPSLSGMPWMHNDGVGIPTSLWDYPQVPQRDFAKPNLLRISKEQNFCLVKSGEKSDLRIDCLQFHSCNKGPIFISQFLSCLKKEHFKQAFVLASQALQSGSGLQV